MERSHHREKKRVKTQKRHPADETEYSYVYNDPPTGHRDPVEGTDYDYYDYNNESPTPPPVQPQTGKPEESDYDYSYSDSQQPKKPEQRGSRGHHRKSRKSKRDPADETEYDYTTYNDAPLTQPPPPPPPQQPEQRNSRGQHKKVRKPKRDPADETEYDYPFYNDETVPFSPPVQPPPQRSNVPQPQPSQQRPQYGAPPPPQRPSFGTPPPQGSPQRTSFGASPPQGPQQRPGFGGPPVRPQAGGGNYFPGTNPQHSGMIVDLPRKVELTMPGGPEISKFEKRKKKAKAGKIKVYQDAANSCVIEMDDFGNLMTVMLSDDLNHTYLKFGKEEYHEAPPIKLNDNRLIPATPHKKPFLKDTPKLPKWAGQQVMYAPIETMSTMGQNKHYKKIKVRKQKLKGRKAKAELLFAADKADLVVDEYTDKVGRVYVAFPERRTHKTYLFALPERLNVITEEFSRDIPIHRAQNDQANWYVQDTSSEESEEEPYVKPLMAETAIDAVEDDIPVNIRRNTIGFRGSTPGTVKTWAIKGPAPPNTRVILS